MFAFRPPGSFACGGFSGIRGEELAGAVAARFELLRSDRPEALARPEIEDLLSPAGEAAFIDPASGLGGLFTSDVALDRIMSIEPLSGGAFRVMVRLYDLGGTGKLGEELILRAGTNISGDNCPSRRRCQRDRSLIGGRQWLHSGVERWGACQVTRLAPREAAGKIPSPYRRDAELRFGEAVIRSNLEGFRRGTVSKPRSWLFPLCVSAGVHVRLYLRAELRSRPGPIASTTTIWRHAGMSVRSAEG
jgi:hypothetical protein